MHNIKLNIMKHLFYVLYNILLFYLYRPPNGFYEKGVVTLVPPY